MLSCTLSRSQHVYVSHRSPDTDSGAWKQPLASSSSNQRYDQVSHPKPRPPALASTVASQTLMFSNSHCRKPSVTSAAGGGAPESELSSLRELCTEAVQRSPCCTLRQVSAGCSTLVCSRWKEAAKGPFNHRCDECIINVLTQLRCSCQSGHRVTRACVAAEPPSRAA